jgi:hypothetical protein
MPRYLKNCVLNTGLTAVSIFLTLLAVEGALWLFNLPPYPEHVYNVLELDIENGYRFRPNARSRRSSWEYETPVSINSIGIRDYDSINNNSEPYAFLLGDSFAEGHGVNIEQTIAKRLQEKTGKLVINLGIASSGTIQAINIFRRYLGLFAHKPRYAVLLFYVGNDYYDNRRFYDHFLRTGRPHETVSNGYLVEDGTTIVQKGNWQVLHNSAGQEIRRTKNPAFHPPKGYENKYLDWSKIYNAYAWINISRNENCQINNAIPGLLDSSYDFESSIEWTVTKRLLKKFIKLAKDNSVTPVIAIMPSKFQLNPILLRQAGCDIQKLDSYKSIEVLENYAKKNNIINLNLAKVFLALPPNDFDKLYYSIDVHLTSFGNEIAANAISEILK